MRRVALLAVLAAGLAAIPAAQATEQLVTGTVAPLVGIGLGSDSAPSGTESMTVTREQRGDTLYVTVIPAR